MEINYELKLSDLEAGNAYLKKSRRPAAGIRWRFLVIWIVFVVVYVHFLPRLDAFDDLHIVNWIWQLTFVTLIGSVLLLPRWLRSASARRWLERFTGNMSLTLTPAGIASTTADGRMALRAWPEFIAFSADDAYYYLYLRYDIATIVPRAQLGDQAEAFAERFHELWAAHPLNKGKTLPQDPPMPGAGRVKQFFANVLGGARIAFLMDFLPNRFNVSGYHAFRLIAVQLVCAGIADFLDSLPRPAFDVYGLPGYGTLILLVILATTTIAGMLLQRNTALRLIIMIASATLVIGFVVELLRIVLLHALPQISLAYKLTHILYVVWVLLAVFRISMKYYLQPWPGALVHAGLFAFFVFALGSLLPGPTLFYNDRPETDPYYQQAERLNAEDTFYRQPELIQKALATFTPRKPGKAALYYVGFAGDGREQVFTNEIDYAQGLLDRRFGTAGHSLVMDNNLQNLSGTPLANRHNLDAVLKGIAARMDKQHDVLFLFLSSHGGQDHTLSVSHWPLGLKDLKAEDLKEMLDRYGIKNRVIVVSACYSGGFLDVLKDDNTLIITASSRSHVAYGCGDYTRYTYFGEAYFVNALAHENNFIDAYNDAREQIAARENGKGESHSEPQIYIGRNIQAVLQRLPVLRVGESMPGNKAAASLATTQVIQ